MNKDSLIYTIIFSFVVTFIFVFFLAMANIGTKDLVAENNKLASATAVLGALGIEYDSSNRSEVFDTFDQVTEHSEDDGTLWYEYSSNGETKYALSTSGPGLWGTIEVVIGFNSDVSRYTGLEIVDQSETPGLGGRITEQWYKEQFAGQLIPEAVLSGGKITLASAGSDAADDYDDEAIDAITGATRTSEGMQAIVSQAARDMKNILGGM